jgi:hypothetical protein
MDRHLDRHLPSLPIRELGAGAGLRRPTQPRAPVEGANHCMIARQPGVALQSAGKVARRFSEIEAALSGS